MGPSEAILTPELKCRGFDVQEDDHCLYLLYEGERVAAFAVTGAKVEVVRDVAEKMDAHKLDKKIRKPRCHLAGSEANVFILAGRVWMALNDAGMPERAAEFIQRLSECQGYDEALSLMREYVEIY